MESAGSIKYVTQGGFAEYWKERGAAGQQSSAGSQAPLHTRNMSPDKLTSCRLVYVAVKMDE